MNTAYDKGKCFESIVAAFPGGQIETIDSRGYTFVVKDSVGTIWYVETMSNKDASITTKRQLFKGDVERRKQ